MNSARSLSRVIGVRRSWPDRRQHAGAVDEQRRDAVAHAVERPRHLLNFLRPALGQRCVLALEREILGGRREIVELARQPPGRPEEHQRQEHQREGEQAPCRNRRLGRRVRQRQPRRDHRMVGQQDRDDVHLRLAGRAGYDVFVDG